uniref:Uncharacterized protein n=1 Tax=Rhizophora mucronata TaxID=61149 RepID=A0A2P2NL75_RHIMU
MILDERRLILGRFLSIHLQFNPSLYWPLIKKQTSSKWAGCLRTLL